jgi:hypothetical protein
MIQQFNFYDIFGYLIPGMFWLVLLSIPFIMKGTFQLPSATESTLLALVGGYITGHVLSGMARKIFPSTKYRVDGRVGRLSERLLDPGFTGSERLTDTVRNELKKHMERRFNVDIDDLKERKDVFWLCRTALAQGKAGSYVEQYQGLYSFSRAAGAACFFATAFYLGWILGVFFCSPTWKLLLSVLCVLLAGVPVWIVVKFDPKAVRWVTFKWKDVESLAFAYVLLVAGFVADQLYPLELTHTYLLALFIAILLLACLRFVLASEAFDVALTQAIYRDFIVLSTGKTVPETND